MTGNVFDIKECSVHDGNGIRTTVFLKGCPLRCVWCHNPEGLSKGAELMVKESKCVHCGLCKKPCLHEDCKEFGRCLHVCPNGCIEVCGKEYTAENLCEKLQRNKEFFDSCGGGVTFSGGEPLFQPDFLCECLDLLSVNTAIETCGYAEKEVFDRVLDKVDFVIFDVKLASRENHIKYTGIPNDLILSNLKALKKSGKPHLFRTPLIPDITDTKENLQSIEKLIGDSPWEKLPYNALAGLKYPIVGRKYPLSDMEVK